jgi:hypothetical protein
MPHIRIFRRAELAILPYRWRDRRKGLALGSPWLEPRLDYPDADVKEFPGLAFFVPISQPGRHSCLLLLGQVAHWRNIATTLIILFSTRPQTSERQKSLAPVLPLACASPLPSVVARSPQLTARFSVSAGDIRSLRPARLPVGSEVSHSAQYFEPD